MKKRKILILVSALLVLTMALCACGNLKAAKPSKVLSGYYEDENKLLTSATQVDFAKAVIKTMGGKFVVLCDSTGDHNVWTVYNLESGSSVYTYTEAEKTSCGIRLYETALYHLGLFTVTVTTHGEGDVKDTYTTTLYNEAGAQIASSNKATEPVYIHLDLFGFNDKYYRVAKDKTYADAFEVNDLAGSSFVSKPTEMTENYYYELSEENEIVAYDKSLNPVAYYALPSYALNATIGILKDGYVLVQYEVKQPEDATEYDYYDGASGEKYNLVTEVYDVKKDKADAIDLEYRVTELYARDADVHEIFNMFTDKVTVVACVYEITDKRINRNDDAEKYVVMNEKGKVQSSLTDAFADMSGMPMAIAENRYMYRTQSGCVYLVDTDGTVLGNVSNVVTMNDKYLMTEKKLYNYDLSVAYDYDAEDMTLYRYTDEAVFFEKEGEIYLYNGTLTKLIAKEDIDTKTLQIEDSYYVVENHSDALHVTYTYYSASGVHLMQTEIVLAQVAQYDGVLLFGGTEELKPVYYRFAA